MKNRRLGFSSLLVVLALVAVACGDDDATTTTAAVTTTAATATTAVTTTLPPEPQVAYDLGVTPAPCADAVNEGNGCIYLGVISDLTDGPFAALGVPLTTVRDDFDGGRAAYGRKLTLVRPDQHVAWVEDGATEAIAVLRKATGAG